MNSVSKFSSSVRRIAVIGSGVAGLTSARLLQQGGHDVVVFEKSRGPGGRLAAKRVPGNPDLSVDMGAQYFTVRSPEFRDFLAQNVGDEAFAEWPGRLRFQRADGVLEPFPEDHRYVGTPRMTAITRALSEGVSIRANVRIERMARDAGCWQVVADDGRQEGGFDAVLVTAPPAQSLAILENSGLKALSGDLPHADEGMLPCWAAAVHLPEPVDPGFDGLRPAHPALFWVANNSTKPARAGEGQWWVLHASADWTRAHLDDPAGDVARQLFEAFRDVAGVEAEMDNWLAHRWLYARSENQPKPGHLWSPEQCVGVAGDWLCGGRVEGAFLSAAGLVAAMG